MKHTGSTALALLIATAGLLTAPAAADDSAVRARATLSPPGGPLPAQPEGRMDVEVRPADAGHAASSRLRIDVHATGVTAYTMWADDPSTADPALVQFASFTTPADGHTKLDYDSRHGDPMPFGASLADLGGRPIEMRTGADTILEGTIPVATGKTKPVHMRGKSDLTRELGSAFPESAGRVRAEAHEADPAHPSWSRISFDLRELGNDAHYTLWGDDPAIAGTDLAQFESVKTDSRGHVRATHDTRKGDPLPFGATLSALGGLALEVRDGDGNAVLSGFFPVPQGPPQPVSGPPLKGKGDLVPPGGPLPPPPTGRIDEEIRAATATSAARSHLRLTVDHLAPDASFTLWGDDPSTPDTALTQFGELSTDARGRGAFDADSSDGDPMPFAAALTDLGGHAVEVRDATSAVILTGAFATMTGPAPAPEPTLRGRSDLTRPVGSAFPLSVGHIEVEVRPATLAEPSTSRLKIEIRGLAAVTAYALFADDPATADPSLVQFATLTTDAHGNRRVTYDTRNGDTLPFDASLADLGGRAIEVRDGADAVVLSGMFPVPQ